MVTFVTAQEKPKVTESAPTLTTEQQKTLKEALAASEKANVELQTAQVKADAARQHFFALLYSTMAEISVKPSEWAVALSPSGDIGFERITAAKTGTVNPGAKTP